MAIIKFKTLLSLIIFSVLLIVNVDANGQIDDKRYIEAKQLFLSGNSGQARILLTEIIEDNPNNCEDAKLLRAYCALSTNDVESAATDLKASESKLYGRYDWDYANACYLSIVGKYSESIIYFDRVIELKKDYTLAYNNRGNAWQQLGNYNKAIDDYRMAIQIDSTFAISYNNLGSAIYYKYNGDQEAASKSDLNLALEYTDKAIRLDPNLCLAKRNKGLILLFLKRNSEALTTLQQAVSCAPNDYVNRLSLGKALSTFERYAEAEVQYKYILEQTPLQPDAMLEFATIQGYLGRYSESYTLLETVSKLRADMSAVSQYRTAITAALEKDKSKMLKHLKKARKKYYFSVRDNKISFIQDKVFKPYQKDNDFVKESNKIRMFKIDAR
ncbi:MAG: tetratricopeptide repeat protein [Bacteroidota bacterium]|nr:tetratricopeptide repeat protein [Bacteroidota bacterium]